VNSNIQQFAARFEAFIHRHEHSVVVLCFLAFLGIGLATFSNYGISFDEPVSRMNGAISLRYVADKFDIAWLQNDLVLQAITIPLHSYQDRDYGVAFDLPAMLIERLFSLNDSREQYLLRHLLTFLTFFVGIIGLYKAAMLRFMQPGYALLACVLLVTSPRIYGEAFYNNKDIVFMSLCAISMYTLIRLQAMPSLPNAIFHGVACALAINIRIAGVIFPCITLLALTLLVCYRTISVKKFCLIIVAYLSITAICTYGFWPWLWETPRHHFLLALKNMSQFRWEHFNLYDGEYIYAKKLPWHYILTWIAITVPILFSFSFVIGVTGVLKRFLKHPIQSLNNCQQRQDLLILALASGPVVASLVLNSTLYDGWRQLYFVYPAFLLLSVCGAQSIISQKLMGAKVAQWVVIAFAVQITLNMTWMIRNHPYQFLYFNELISTSDKYKYEYDYWGVTNLKGIQFILSNDSSERITIKPLGATSIEQSISMIQPKDRKRLVFDPMNGSPDYILTNYRVFDGSRLTGPSDAYVVFYELVVDGRPALTIYRNKDYKK
jgi:hypothetical protein